MGKFGALAKSGKRAQGVLFFKVSAFRNIAGAIRIVPLLLLFLFTMDSRGQAAFGGELQRWTNSQSSTTQAITLSNAINSGSVAVICLGIEAPSNVYVLTASDSKGNSWNLVAQHIVNSVHQQFMLAGFISAGLLAGDTITLTWTNPAAGVYAQAGDLCYLTGCASAQPDVSVGAGSYGTTVTAPGTTLSYNDILIGIEQNDQMISTYSPGAWTQIGAIATFGHTPTTDGLANTYMYFSAGPAGQYDPGGTMNSNNTYQVNWVGFKPKAGTVYYVDFAGGNDSNGGTNQTSPWQHCPGDTNATGVPASKALTAGDTVIFKGGVSYVGEEDVACSGSNGIPITYDGNSAGTWGTGKAVFDCSTNYYHAIAAPHTLGSRDHIVINGFDIEHLKNVSYATQLVNTVQGSLDLPGTTNTVTLLGNNGVYSYGGVFVYGYDWTVSNCNLHESEQWWYRTLATGNPVANVPCLQAGIDVYTGTNVLISNCAIWDIGLDCIRAQGTNITIAGCNLGGPSSIALTNRGWFAVAVRAAGYFVNSTIRNCLIHDGWQLEGDESAQRCHAGDWIHMYGNNNGILDNGDPNNILIDSCYMYNDQAFNYANGTGNLYMEQDAWNITIRNCLIVNPQHMAVWTSGGTVSNINILNNTIVCFNPALGGGAFALYAGSTVQGFNATNNLITELVNNSAAMPFVVLASPPAETVSSDYNLYYNPLTAVYGSVRYTNADLSLTTWSGSAAGNDVHSIVGNPLFTYLPPTGATSSAGKYYLSSSSPAVGSGANLSTIFSTDINGSNRTAPWDIGAFMFTRKLPPPTDLRVVQ